MQKLLAILVMALFLSVTARSQDEADAPAAGQEEQSAESEGTGEATGAAESDDGAEIEDSELDDQTYEGDDDEFIPTEEVPVDEPIPFPTDI